MGKTMNGLNVLLIATSFFGYEKKMKEAIEKNGAIVNYYDERSIKSSYEKALQSPLVHWQRKLLRLHI